MALIYCPECAHQVSDQSNTCPNCGYPIAQRRQVHQQPNSTLPPLPSALPKPRQNNTAYLMAGFGIGIFLVALLFAYVLNRKNDGNSNTTAATKTVAPKQATYQSQVNPDTSGLVPIPMLLAGNGEDGRYFLIAHRQQDGIDEIDYVRTRNEAISDQTVTYGRMQLKCGANKIRSNSSDQLEHLDTIDLGKWYTPTPDWTNKDIYNFICNRKTVKNTETATTVEQSTAENNNDQTEAAPLEDASSSKDYEQNQYQVTSGYETQKAEEPTKQVEQPRPIPKKEAEAKSAPLQEVAPAPVIVTRPKYSQNLEPQKQSYTNQIASIIKSNWKLPMKPKFNSVRATFSIAPNGRVTNIQIHSDDIYAQSTLYQAIESSSPLPPVPNGLEDEFAYNSMTFRIQ